MLLVLFLCASLLPNLQLETQAAREVSSDSDETLQLDTDEEQPKEEQPKEEQPKEEQSKEEQPKESRAALCVKNSGHVCKKYTEGAIVDTLMQCRRSQSSRLRTGSKNASAENHSATCDISDDSEATHGHCMCMPGYCADSDLKCWQGEYRMLDDIFTLTIKDADIRDIVYMDADGTVKLGRPPDPKAGQWRISITPKGTKLLSTEMYLDTILQEYESCMTKQDDISGLSWSSCSLMVGHTKEPRADEMGWFIEAHDPHAVDEINHEMHLPGANGHSIGKQFYVQLRSAKTKDVMYFNTFSKSAHACQATSKSCPGVSGAIAFDPPIVGRTDIKLDDLSSGLPIGIYAFLCTLSIFFVAVLVLACAHTFKISGFSKSDARSPRVASR